MKTSKTLSDEQKQALLLKTQELAGILKSLGIERIFCSYERIQSFDGASEPKDTLKFSASIPWDMVSLRHPAGKRDFYDPQHRLITDELVTEIITPILSSRIYRQISRYAQKSGQPLSLSYTESSNTHNNIRIPCPDKAVNSREASGTAVFTLIG